MKRVLPKIILLAFLLTSCASVDLNASLPSYDSGVDPETWIEIPAGEFYFGQFNEIKSTGVYEIMQTDVTTAQYAAFLNQTLSEGTITVSDDQILGYYPGDEFNGAKT